MWKLNGGGHDLRFFRKRLRGFGLDDAFEFGRRLNDLLKQDLSSFLQLLQHGDDRDCFPVLLRPPFQLHAKDLQITTLAHQLLESIHLACLRLCRGAEHWFQSLDDVAKLFQSNAHDVQGLLVAELQAIESPLCLRELILPHGQYPIHQTVNPLTIKGLVQTADFRAQLFHFLRQTALSAALQRILNPVDLLAFAPLETTDEVADHGTPPQARNSVQLDLHVSQRAHAFEDLLETPLHLGNVSTIRQHTRQFQSCNYPPRVH